MSKYDPLYDYLRKSSTQPGGSVPLTFRQIENILGSELPDSAGHYREWRSNEEGPTRHTQCKAWMDAGYAVNEVDFEHLTVEFVRV